MCPGVCNFRRLRDIPGSFRDDRIGRLFHPTQQLDFAETGLNSRHGGQGSGAEIQLFYSNHNSDDRAIHLQSHQRSRSQKYAAISRTYSTVHHSDGINHSKIQSSDRSTQRRQAYHGRQSAVRATRHASYSPTHQSRQRRRLHHAT